MFSLYMIGEFNGLLLVDRKYPHQPTLLTPYPDTESGHQQHFNVAHCRTKACLKRTIVVCSRGLLKASSQCLHHHRLNPERAHDIIVPCVVLYHITTIRGEQYPPLPMEGPEKTPSTMQTSRMEGPSGVNVNISSHTVVKDKLFTLLVPLYYQQIQKQNKLVFKLFK